MSEKPKDRFWRLHLSTAVFLSLVAGFLMSTEATGRPDYPVVVVSEEPLTRSPDSIQKVDIVERTQTRYGWPFEYCSIVTVAVGTNFERSEYWDKSYILVDGAVAILMIGFAASALEWATRRRGPEAMSEKPSGSSRCPI